MKDTKSFQCDIKNSSTAATVDNFVQNFYRSNLKVIQQFLTIGNEDKK